MTVSAFSSAFGGTPPHNDTFLKSIRLGPYGRASGFPAYGTNGNYALFVFYQPVSIEKITLRSDGTVSTAGTVQFKVIANGTALNTANRTITAAEAATQFTDGSSFDIPLAADGTSGNLYSNVPAGSILVMTTASTVDASTSWIIDVVLRTKPFRRADGSAAGDGLGNVIQG